MSKPKVDVIIPFFNSERFIEETFQAVLGQTSDAINRLIMINDGSVDDSLSIVKGLIEEAGDLGIEFILHTQPNQGHASAVNKGLSFVTAEYVALCDSDDVWYENKIEEQLKVFLKDSQIGVVYCDYCIIDENSKVNLSNQIKRVIPCLSGEIETKLLQFGNRISSSNSGVLIKSKLLEGERFDEEFVACEDWDMWVRLASKCLFDYSSEKLVKIRRHSNNQSADIDLMYKYDIDVVLKHVQRKTTFNLSLILERVRKYYRLREIASLLFRGSLSKRLSKEGFTLKIKIKAFKKLFGKSLFNIFLKKILGRRTSRVILKGGFGNQLFQYSFGLFYSRKYNVKVYYDDSYYLDNRKGVTPRKVELSKFIVNFKSSHLSKFAYKFIRKFQGHFVEKSFQYNDLYFDLNSRSNVFDGFWQSYRYVDEIRDELIKNLGIKAFDSIREKTVSIHIRRGDYVTNKSAADFHGSLSEEYYLNAINTLKMLLGSKLRFVVFSDEIEWVRENMFKNLAEDLEYCQLADFREEFYYMNSSQHFIIANSSFSWWAAYLGQSEQKIVVAPEKWFLDDSISTRDLFPRDWKLI